MKKRIIIGMALLLVFAYVGQSQALANRVAIPDAGSLTVGQELVTTGRTGSLEITTCNSIPLNVARYGVIIGPGQEHYDKHHWESDPGRGAKATITSSLGSCVLGTTQYYLYDVVVE